MKDFCRWLLTDPKGVNNAADGDNFVWLGLEGDNIDIQSCLSREPDL